MAATQAWLDMAHRKRKKGQTDGDGKNGEKEEGKLLLM